MVSKSYTIEKLYNLLLLIMTLVVITVCLEIGARLFTNIQPGVKQRDAKIGYRYRRSFSTNIYDEESGREIYMRFNSLGFRGPDFGLEKPANVTRVAFLGDSMIAALQVDEEDTMVQLLQTMGSAAEPDREWEVMNFGVSGSSPAQAITIWREEVKRFRPDIVLLGYFVGNDLADNCRCLTAGSDRIYFDIDSDGVYRQQPNSETGVAISVFLNENSSFYLWQKKAFRALKTRLRGTTSDGKMKPYFREEEWIYSSKENDSVARAWNLTNEAITTLRDDVTRQGAKFAVIMIPQGYQIYDDAFAAMTAVAPAPAADFDQDYPDQRLGSLCAAAGIPFLSMLDQFRAAAPARSVHVEDERLFLSDGLGHFNEKGNLIAAQTVHEFLMQLIAQETVAIGLSHP